MKITTIPDLKQAWGYASVWVASLVIAWGMVPSDWQLAVLSAIGVPEHRQGALIGVLFLIARLTTNSRNASAARGSE